jgi:drug/metabolite transporter (DMT)-like permease
MIRLADAPALTVATYRLALAAAVVAPITLWRHHDELRQIVSSPPRPLIISGLSLALHFALWISSLGYTSVTSSVILVTTNPLFVALASPLVLAERVGARVWAGVVLAVAGGILVALGKDNQVAHRTLLGDGLALGGAVMAAVYFMAGRRLRPRTSLLPYILLVYALAALVLLAMALLSHAPLTGYAPRTYALFVALALVPQLIGHSSFNWALAHLKASLVAITVLGEPLGSSLLAWLVLREAPSLVEAGGGCLVLSGVALAWGGRK